MNFFENFPSTIVFCFVFYGFVRLCYSSFSVVEVFIFFFVRPRTGFYRFLVSSSVIVILEMFRKNYVSSVVRQNIMVKKY